ncbi:MAG TPA: hypothetical protein VHE35_22835 [Kofleriaceae bacterium]|nr:hypothetical protein [Kofleriaceae bacterium]
MPTAPRLILRADAGHRLGSGHVMRLSALAEAALDAGGAARILIGGEPAASVAALTARGLDAVASASEPSAAAISRHADELGAQAIVLDGPHFDPAWVAALAAGGRLVASLDDRGLSPLPTSVVINPGYGAESLADRYPAAATRLLGRRYHLLRRELRDLPHAGAPLADRVHRVLVTMGGSDPVGATARVVGAMPGERLDVIVVLGPGFRDHAALAMSRARARARGHRVELVANPPSLGPVLASCDLAISAAGGTLAELAYLGRPTYAVAIVDDQVDLAARQRAAGLVAGGLPLASLTDDELTGDLAALLADPARLRTLRAASAATIDALGPTRILAALVPPDR